MAEPERWLPFLKDLPEDRLHHLENRFFAEAKLSAAADEKELEALYAVLGSVCSYYYRPDEPLDPYGPQMIMNGSRTAIPCDLRESDLDALSAILPALVPVNVRARVADALWIRRRDRAAAEVAVLSYVDASRRWPADWTHDAIEQIERAIQIAAQLGRGGIELASQAIERVQEMLGEPDMAAIGPQRHLVGLLTQRGESDGLEPYLAESSARAEQLRDEGSHNDARLWFELAAEIAGALNRGEEARRNEVAAAETWVAEAEIAASGESPSYMRAAGLLEFAIKSYRKVGGMRSRVDELHEKMLRWQELTHGEMHKFSTEIDLTDLVNNSMERVSDKPLPQALAALAFAYGYREVDKIREEVVRLMNDHPLQFLISKSFLDSKGRVIARPPAMSSSDEDATEAAIQAEMFSQARNTMGIVVQGSINPARRVIIAEHPLTFAEIFRLIGPSPFIPAGHEPMYAKGLWAGFNGDFAVAAAILAPELENALRDEMDSRGVMLPRLDADATHKVRQLGELLYCSDAETVYGAAKLFMLKAVLCNDFGADMRDKVAHGLMSYPEYAGAEAAFMWWLALRLAIEPMIQVVDEEDGSQKPGYAAAAEDEGDETRGST